MQPAMDDAFRDRNAFRTGFGPSAVLAVLDANGKFLQSDLHFGGLIVVGQHLDHEVHLVGGRIGLASAANTAHHTAIACSKFLGYVGVGDTCAVTPVIASPDDVDALCFDVRERMKKLTAVREPAPCIGAPGLQKLR